MARPGHERFTAPTLVAQRRYEALRAFWVEELSPQQVAERFDYTLGSVRTLISRYRQADLSDLFATARPGPKRQPKKDAARARAIELRRQRHGIEEIVETLSREGTPLSRTAVWELLREAGLSRMPRAAKPSAGSEQPQQVTQLMVGLLAMAVAVAGFAPWLALQFVHWAGGGLREVHQHAQSAHQGARSAIAAPQRLYAGAATGVGVVSGGTKAIATTAKKVRGGSGIESPASFGRPPDMSTGRPRGPENSDQGAKEDE